MKAWRESATLILVAGRGQRYSPPSASRYNYDLLCLKRNQNSGFMPGTYVFPGGEVHPADASLKWGNLLSRFGLGNEQLSSLIPKVQDSRRPGIFKAGPDELPRDISLRITAIRETFEETGILLCTRAAPTSGWARYMNFSEGELEDWQKRVHDNAKEFYSLCESMNCYPDLWSVHEWNNWLGPTFLPKRFDTVFYMACLPDRPRAVHEEMEVEELRWADPKTLLESKNGEILPIPQQYEIARLSEFQSIESLLDRARKQSEQGARFILAVKVQLKDGIVHVFPGDSFYPEVPSLVERQVIDKSHLTIKELRDQSAVKHRMEMYNEPNVPHNILIDNYENASGDRAHMEWKIVQGLPKSKQ